MDSAASLHPWLATPWQAFNARLAAGRVPQALLIHGPAGLGKMRLAELFAQKLLCAHPGEFACGQCPGCRLFLAGTHPDFIKVQPAEPGKGIGVDAVRQLIASLALKSQYGGFRAVVIAPAHLMNISAANALLKTLEEPADNTAILLLTEAPSALPATILSRCQRLPVAAPDRDTARRWLESASPGCPAEVLLAAAGDSPLKALALAGTDAAERRRAVFAECAALLAGKAEPVAVAERWQGLAHEEFIDWMIAWTADLIRLGSAPAGIEPRNADFREDLRSMAGRIHLDNLFDLWKLLLQSKRALGGQINRQLLLEDLLIRWSELGQSHKFSRSFT
ncbi:DNA polymerase III subunit delta' [Methylomagnum sp.]